MVFTVVATELGGRRTGINYEGIFVTLTITFCPPNTLVRRSYGEGCARERTILIPS